MQLARPAGSGAGRLDDGRGRPGSTARWRLRSTLGREQLSTVLPGEVQGGGCAGCEAACVTELVERVGLERDCVGGDGAFGVRINGVGEQLIVEIGLDHGDGQNVGREGQGVEADAQAGDPECSLGECLQAHRRVVRNNPLS